MIIITRFDMDNGLEMEEKTIIDIIEIIVVR